MTEKATILVVEDESIVAMDLRQRLTAMGYAVPALAGSAPEALKKAEELRPDLVLMDIRLRGDMDGIETAEQIHDLFGVPPVYLTAYTDADTLRRAKITEPFGYVVKPFDERTLRSTIEMALYHAKSERQLKRHEAWLEATLRCVSEGLVGADENWRVVFMNAAAEALLGRKRAEASGLDLFQVVRFEGEREQQRARQLMKEVRENFGQNGTAPPALVGTIVGSLVPAQGGNIPVEARVTSIAGKWGGIGGVVVAIRAGDFGHGEPTGVYSL